MERYVLPDPELRAYDRGVGTLTVDGVLRGHLASTVGEIIFPGRSPWLWFTIVWADGTKESPFEDYGPSWDTVRELDAGYLEHFGPSVREDRKGWFGRRFEVWRLGPPCRFEFAWLPRDEAAETWQTLGLADTGS
jgi:hypothetical protein